MEETLGNGSLPPPPGRRKKWAWFFAVLVLLTAAAVIIQIAYNIRQQLTREQLAAARQLWADKGPADYDLRYTVQRIDSRDDIRVRVRQKKAVSVFMNDQTLEERLFRYHEMRALFDFIEGFLTHDEAARQKGQRRPFVVATFDPVDGHLIRYIRSAGGKERVEILVELKPASEGGSR